MVEKKKKRNKSMLLGFILGLSIGCLVSCVFLAGFLVEFAQQSKVPTVDVGVTDDKNKVEVDSNTNTDTNSGNKDKVEEVKKKYNLKSGFEVVDLDQTWVGHTGINIFKVSYDETGDITVEGNGNKVIAPGTMNSYYFDLVNTGQTGIDYQMKMEAILSDNITSIPVEVKLNDQDGKYVVGTETTWNDVVALNDVNVEGQISKGHKMRYMFSWQWPYESGNDEFDTMLGNLAVGEDVTLTIKISTLATGNGSATGGIVATGDNSKVMVYALGAGVSAVLMIFFVILGKKGEDDEAED